MTEQTPNPEVAKDDEDTTGHVVHAARDTKQDDDTTGHVQKGPQDTDDDDTEGHVKVW